TFDVTDGTATTPSSVSWAITGTNDVATIGGNASAALTELNATQSTGGTLTIADVDDGEAVLVPQVDAPGNHGYGLFNVDADGVWTYTMNSAHNEFVGGQQYTDSITVTSLDGSATQTITVTIDGTNDPAVITGVSTGAAVEAGGVGNGTAGSNASGDLNSTDVDGTDDAWTAVSSTATASDKGSYTIDGSGNWVYAVNNANATVQGLNVGQSTTDSFSVTTADGTAQTVTVTINGANDAATIGGTATGSVTENSPTTTATGTLTAADVDNTANLFQAAAAGSATANGYGTFALTTGGAWTYTLNNANASVNGLNAGGTLTDSFVAKSADGTQQTVSVTINGANDAAVITGATTGTAVEAGGVANGTAGSNATGNLNSTDVDNTADAWTVVSSATATVSGKGTYTIDASGNWVYAVNNADATVQGLNSGQTTTDTFSVTTVDGTSQTVTVTINGANDAATIGGTSSGAITEDAVPNTLSGTLTATDVDNTANLFQAAASGSATTNGYGTFAVTTGGVWTYTLNNANATVNALNTGSTLTDTFNVLSADGTSKAVTVTINGATDDNTTPTDITFTLDTTSANAVASTGNNTGTGDIFGTLGTVDTGSTSWTYSIVSINGNASATNLALSDGTNTGAAVSGATAQLVVGAGGMTNGTNYDVIIRTTDAGGNSFNETFRVNYGGTGNDTFTGSSNSDLFFGSNGNDVLPGIGGSDYFMGGAGTDNLNGGIGNDVLWGGGNSDTFTFSSFGAANADLVMDFDASGGGNQDTIALSRTGFGSFALGAVGNPLNANNFVTNAGTPVAGDSNDYILYNSSTGQLYYDADGNGTGSTAQLIATLTVTAGTVDASDFLIIA
ncbi:beta strand repeat-containing protein, partial [Novosphingobium bradum]